MMNSTTITVEVTDIFSTYGDNESHSLQIRVDDKFFEDKLQTFKPIIVSLDSVKKDVKVGLRLMKSDQIIGNGELSISQSLFLSKEKLITKWVGLNPVIENLPKKTGSIISTMSRIQLKVSISYGDLNDKPKEKTNLRTVSQGKNPSRTPDQSKEYKQLAQKSFNSKIKGIETPKDKNKQSKDDTIDILRVIRGKQPIKNQIKNGICGGSQNSSLLNSDRKETSKQLEETPREDLEEKSEKNLDTSLINEIFNEEKSDQFESPKDLSVLIDRIHNTFSNTYFENLPEEEEILKKEAQVMIRELLNLQECYYRGFNDSISLNQKIREFLIKYGSNYRLINKKNNKLKQMIESNNDKYNMAKIIIREENERFRDIMNINTQELRNYKEIFHVKYLDSDLIKFKEEVANRNEEKDKKLLLKTAEILFKNSDNLTKLSDEKRNLLISLLEKYEIRFDKTDPIDVNNILSNEETKEEIALPESSNIDQDEKNNTQPTDQIYNSQPIDQNYNTHPQNQNKIEFSDNDEDEQEQELNKEIDQEQNKQNVIHINNNVEEKYQPKFNDQVDQKLGCFLNDLYAKKRVSNIPFRRVSQGNYEFGTQKVLVKLENEKIKVRVGGGYLLLDKFIEMNMPVEEAKLINAKNITAKFSKNSNVKKQTGGKAIYSIEGPDSKRSNNKTPDKFITSN